VFKGRGPHLQRSFHLQLVRAGLTLNVRQAEQPAVLIFHAVYMLYLI
jgi:hypothetical protein